MTDKQRYEYFGLVEEGHKDTSGINIPDDENPFVLPDPTQTQTAIQANQQYESLIKPPFPKKQVPAYKNKTNENDSPKTVLGKIGYAWGCLIPFSLTIIYAGCFLFKIIVDLPLDEFYNILILIIVPFLGICVISTILWCFNDTD